MPVSPRWPRVAPVLVALVLAGAAHAPALRPDVRLAGRDLFTVYAPLFRRVAAAWRGEGSLLRDPLRGAGMPLLADPLAQVAYPPGWLRAALPFELGHALLFPLHAALCGIGAALLARRLGAGPRGACLAAAGASLAGPVLAACRTPNLLAGVAWAGFALAGLVELSAGGARARRGLALAGASLGLMLLAGGVELVMLVGLGAVALALGGAVDLRAGLRHLALAALAAGLAGALAAVHLGPCLAWLPHSGRGAAGAIPASEAAAWAEHPLRLIETVLPGVSPGAAPGLLASPAWAPVRGSFGAFGHPLNASLHLGLPIVGLALLAAWGARRRALPARGVALAGGLWLLVALELGRWPLFGSRAPIFELLHALPGFSGWRYPGKALLLVSVVTCALAGRGLARLPGRAQLAAGALTAALGLLAQRLDPAVLPTLPATLVETPPPLAQEILADPRDGLTPPPRFLRVALPPVRPGDGFQAVRAAHLAVLVEDLSTRFGIPELRAYPPFYDHRLDGYLAARGATILDLRAGRLQADALAREACVGWMLTPDGLERLPAAPRVRLDGAAGALTLRSYGATRIECDLRLPSDGAVFVSEASAPGWVAELDPRDGGAARTVEPEVAAGMFMRVPCPAGEWRMALTYHPPRLVLGALLTALGLAALVALVRGGYARRP